jgi:mono/diheme cytochrome c family protein
MEWIYKWIKNNKKLRESGDQQAIAIYEEYNGTAMPAYPQLSNQDIDNIVAYAEQPKPEPKQKVAAAPAGGQGGGQNVNGSHFGYSGLCTINVISSIISGQ